MTKCRDADIPGYETNILRISRISSRPGIIRAGYIPILIQGHREGCTLGDVAEHTVVTLYEYDCIWWTLVV